MANEYKVFFFEPRLQAGDIGKALKSFGATPVLMCLNPGNINLLLPLITEMPKTLRIEYRSGVLKSEIWLADQDTVMPFSEIAGGVSKIRPYGNHQGGTITKVKHQGKRGRGRPRIIGPVMSRTTMWRRRKEAPKQGQEVLI